METTKNYNGVTIEKSWSLVAFAKEFGKPKIAKCVNHESGECFKTLVFDDGENLTWCHFGYSTQEMTPQEIIRERESLKVGRTTNNKYTLYKQGENAWEELNW